MLFTRIGAEFVPLLDEGGVLVECVACQAWLSPSRLRRMQGREQNGSPRACHRLHGHRADQQTDVYIGLKDRNVAGVRSDVATMI